MFSQIFTPPRSKSKGRITTSVYMSSQGEQLAVLPAEMTVGPLEQGSHGLMRVVRVPGNRQTLREAGFNVDDLTLTASASESLPRHDKPASELDVDTIDKQ